MPLLAAKVGLSKDKAAYWDGRNEKVEPVASDVYFHFMEAGESANLRKMVMAKYNSKLCAHVHARFCVSVVFFPLLLLLVAKLTSVQDGYPG